MKTEKRLKLASYFLKFLIGIIGLTVFALVFIYIHSMFSPETYSKVTVTNARAIEYSYGIEKVPETHKEWSSSDKFLYYTKLNKYSKFRVIWTQIISLIIILFLLVLFNKILKNSKNYAFFFKENIKTINQILKLLIVLFSINALLMSFGDPITMVFKEEGKMPSFYTSVRVNFGILLNYPPIFIFFFILREVFKRGQELKQENDLTI